MRWQLLVFSLIFILKDVDSINRGLHRSKPTYLLGLGVPGHLSNVPNFLQLIGGRAGFGPIVNLKHEYPIDFQSQLQRLENKMTIGILDQDEVKFIYDASGISCTHGANFTLDPHPEHNWECHAITCFCITKNSYLCTYESNCTVLLSSLSPKEQKRVLKEYKNEDEHEVVAEEMQENYYLKNDFEEGQGDDYYYVKQQGGNDDDEQEGENDDDYEENQTEVKGNNVEYDDEGEYIAKDKLEEEDEKAEDEGEYIVKDTLEEEDEEAEGEQKHMLLCEGGSIHRLNNFHTPPCMICLCLDHWTLFCATKSLKLCLSDNNRYENGQIIKDWRVRHRNGYGMLDDVDILKSALDEVTAVKEWTEEKKLYYGYKK